MAIPASLNRLTRALPTRHMPIHRGEHCDDSANGCQVNPSEREDRRQRTRNAN